jgi:hypothetical protein
LLKYGFVDKDLHLIDHKGRKVDRKGRLVNNEGFFIDENNNRTDGEGRPIDEQGNYIVEASPFLDDETGDPITPSVGEPDEDGYRPVKLNTDKDDSFPANTSNDDIAEWVEESEKSAPPTVNEPATSAK